MEPTIERNYIIGEHANYYTIEAVYYSKYTLIIT